ncbi:MAG: ABC transporter substrate-binding protein [Acidimicrobiia bacterium]
MKTTNSIVLGMSLLVVASCSPSTSTATRPTPEQSPAALFVGVDGVESDISDTSRIVVLNGDLVEVIFALGAGDRVVGRDLTTTYPPEALSIPDVGLGRRLNAEAVIGLDPTLVLGDTQIAPASAIEQIRAAGIPVVILDVQATLPGVSRKITTIAEILGLEAEGQKAVAGVEAEIGRAQSLAAMATDTPRVAYVYVRGPETLLMFGNGMPTHFLIEAAHGVDALGDTGVVFAEPLVAEQLVAAQPDVLITPIEGFDLIGGLDAFLALPGVADTPAGVTGRIITYDEALFLGMGPRTGEALMQLVVDLHPDLAP